MLGYLGNDVTAGSRSVVESVKCRVISSSSASATDVVAISIDDSIAAMSLSVFVLILIGTTLAIVNLDFLRDRIDRIQVHGASDA